MSGVTLYGINNCDTIKKTRKWLQDRGVEFEFHDYRKDGAPASLIRRFLQEFPAEQLLNRRGTTWRKLGDDEKAQADSNQLVKLLGTYPALIKRPLLNRGKHWVLGYDEAELEKLVRS